MRSPQRSALAIPLSRRRRRHHHLTESIAPLLLGEPRFADPHAAALAASGDLAGAWRAQLVSPSALGGTIGDFAVGVATEGSRVTLATDRFSMQTMCWRADDAGLRFDERADRLAGPEREIDPQAIFDYLFFHVIPSPRTVWRGVQRLPPGHRLDFDDGPPVAVPYWRPAFHPSPQPDFGALASAFRVHLETAVRDQLDGSKAACFLSGGTDSSTVAGMISRVAGRAATYSIGFDAEGYDEMAYARLAAKHFGTEHHEYYVTPADLVRSIPKVATSFDQPFGNSSALPAYYCGLMARDNGVTRILAGDGGDELFGGNKRYAVQRIFRVYDHVPQLLKDTLIAPWAMSAWARRLPGARKVSSYVSQAALGLPARLETYNLLMRQGIDRVLTKSFLDSVDAREPMLQQVEVWKAAGADGPLNRHLAYDWRYTLAETDLPKVRETARLAGLAVGFPMLDQRLVDFSLGLPDRYKLRGTKLRWFFKEALRGFLPDAIIGKPKQGFGLPFGLWAVRDAALRQLATDSLHSLAERGVVQRLFIEQLLGERLPSHPGYYGEMVWILMMLEQWLQAHAPHWRLPGANNARGAHRTTRATAL